MIKTLPETAVFFIIASKLGAKSVDAVDIDSMAVKVAEENCAINECANIECYTGELKSVKNAPYDHRVLIRGRERH